MIGKSAALFLVGDFEAECSHFGRLPVSASLQKINAVCIDITRRRAYRRGMKTETKLVDYSYPTSTNATKFNFANGCYTVSVARGISPGKAVAAFATKAEALRFAETLTMPFHRVQTFGA